eukprot:NODE_1819_length_1205_cov_44.681818_g1804_i0.p1 GENE.NODE_1819_length_1205_cov_44.681818_g1804_i0~~NODE_1819_length_1205_cov_44.681818_g1804_i0.p1  ORF type:complete len:275 (+),score=38.58 NODE_1819_length_1205_cov_44.681818_g1804_i0:76-900(+)
MFRRARRCSDKASYVRNFTEQSFNASSVAQSFTEQTSSWSVATGSHPQREASGRWLCQQMSRYCGPFAKFKSGCEVAAGTGIVSRALLHCGVQHMTAVDFTPAMIAAGIKLAREECVDHRLHYCCANVETEMEPQFAFQPFDLIVSRWTLYHLVDWTATMRAMCRMLKPDGHLVVMDVFPPERMYSPTATGSPSVGPTQQRLEDITDTLGVETVAFDALPDAYQPTCWVNDYGCVGAADVGEFADVSLLNIPHEDVRNAKLFIGHKALFRRRRR